MTSEPQWYYHRPLNVLFEAGFSAGFVLDGLREPRLPRPDRDSAGVRWDDMIEIPPILVARMRLNHTESPGLGSRHAE